MTLSIIILMLSSIVAGLLAFTNGQKEGHEMMVRVVTPPDVSITVMPDTVRSDFLMSGGNTESTKTLS